ncbi:predicted GPI-anchored protein 58 [Brachypodium distachyon]|uniref:predicted GPI-anchored protein 58 n=1 Tax=Brachypodium distachyon TaxID=15368 RepID=UPI000D0D4C72|nr:predicted GPI-anchored protein 58 [Brachypodium distachyon]|eukprot:XP_024311846.1 predicted GPI-anchored protein 58 [Brachypodium distachyon]
MAPATGDAPPAASLLETPARTEEEGEAPRASPTALQGNHPEPLRLPPGNSFSFPLRTLLAAPGPSAPAPEAGANVVDLDVEVTGTAEGPKADPTPSPSAPATAATTAATGTASGDTPTAVDAAGADSVAT